VLSLVVLLSAYPSGALEFTPDFSGVCFTRSLVLCVFLVDCSFVLLSFFFWVIVLFVLRFTDSDYPFDIFKLFFYLDEIHVDFTCLGGMMEHNKV
jgi:hypothetical protein